MTRRSDVPSRKQSQVGAVQCASVGRRALAVRGAVWLGGLTYPHESASRAKAGQCATVGRRALASEPKIRKGRATVSSSRRRDYCRKERKHNANVAQQLPKHKKGGFKGLKALLFYRPFWPFVFTNAANAPQHCNSNPPWRFVE